MSPNPSSPLSQHTADVLVVGGSTGGTAAAIQAARRGAQTILVSEFPWLGGMLTCAGVSAPDGNELAALQTGLWGAYLRELQQRQPGGLDRSWVSLFTYNPRIGAEIFAEWVESLPNLQWIRGESPRAVLKDGKRITGVRFDTCEVRAKITLDGTELGDLLSLAEVPHRWGWELQEEFDEPSAPPAFNELTARYPVQAPTWVVFLQDCGKRERAPEIPAPPGYNPKLFSEAWEGYGKEKFLNYGRISGGLLMMNWPKFGNDYGEKLNRLVESEAARREFHQEAFWHSQGFVRFVQQHCGRQYGLATGVFPESPRLLVAAEEALQTAFALHPYYRESRRLRGKVTVTEGDILPIPGGCVAPLPRNGAGEVRSIAVGNYANDHHYPGVKFPLQPKSMRWGGRWTGTPFSLPYDALVPAEVEGLLVCEKNISVSHIANGATRLQPTVMNIGQAAGMAAALCVELGCSPQGLPVRELQAALLEDALAPAAVVPLLNLPPNHPDWWKWQRYYLDEPEAYPAAGCCAVGDEFSSEVEAGDFYRGSFRQLEGSGYRIRLLNSRQEKKIWSLISVRPEVNEKLARCRNNSEISVWGRCNESGGWLLVEKLSE
ncbi:FAD-dependent oxidoreductase [Oscillatoria sp. FACHB-1406]|uniref:FAD-dependent oxidoreductase n=1 Tax=Oscillatoria sp. FACHB-1406 TaxID=2692846 RepID=UPI001682F5BF|nr:FAD-dependent oxidoreductase [Oscillatoria sp. FACHB-1406]MBD2577059.1 FAD-dependent oxidoreductase [Oscillatoria sp. FACHB-1406]